MEQVEQVTRQLVRMPESCPQLGMSEEAPIPFLSEVGPMSPFPGRPPGVWGLTGHVVQVQKIHDAWCCLYSFFHGESFRSGATHSLCFSFSLHTPKHM